MAMPVHSRLQKLRQLPPGRASQAATNVARIALPLRYHLLNPFIEATRDAARTYVELRALRFGESTARGDGHAAKVDRKADVRIAFIHDTAKRYAVELPGTPEAEAAARLLRRYFPRGLKAVVQAPYEEELIQIEALLAGLAADDAHIPRLLTVEHHVAELQALAGPYARALDLQDKVTPGELKAAWLMVHQRMVELCCAIVTLVRDPDHREQIIAPIFEQDDRLAALYARRRSGQVVDDFDLDDEVAGLDDVDGVDDADAAPAAQPPPLAAPLPAVALPDAPLPDRG